MLKTAHARIFVRFVPHVLYTFTTGTHFRTGRGDFGGENRGHCSNLSCVPRLWETPHWHQPMRLINMRMVGPQTGPL